MKIRLYLVPVLLSFSAATLFAYERNMNIDFSGFEIYTAQHGSFVVPRTGV